MPPLLVSAYLSQTRITLAQTLAENGSEVEATLELLNLVALKDATVTADALHCHRRMAAALRTRGADYCLALKATLGLKDGIMHRPNKHHALTPEQRHRNGTLSKVRCSVETVFAVLKRVYGYRRTRYVGLVRNQLQLTLLAICFNLRRMLVLTSHARNPSPA